MKSSKTHKQRSRSQKQAPKPDAPGILNLSLDNAATGLIAILSVLVSLTILLGEQAGVRVRVNLPENGLVAPYQTITFTFSEPYNPGFASELVSMNPIHEGYLEWVDTYTMRFVPIRPFELGVTYTLKFEKGEVETRGREVKKAQTWEFKTREPLVAYMLADETSSSIWAVDLNGNPPKRLTDESVKVISFDAARIGEFIIFTVANEQGGVDLWRVSRAGGDAFLLLDCGRDRCTTPAISPDGLRIAYSREFAGPSPELPFGSPRIWILDLQSRQNNAVYEDQEILGYNPSWAPNSNKLASYDGLSDQIFMLDLREKTQSIFSSNTGGPVTWSPDSSKMLFTDVDQAEEGVRTQVKLADLSINKSETLIGAKDDRDYSYYALAWSPFGDNVVLSFHGGDDPLVQTLWLFDPSTLEGIIIADQKDYSYNSPQWDPWGTALIFQQFKLRSTFNPEIGLWQPGFNEPLLLTQGLMPHWLP
ncbi:MAG: PD40 domain-containing protein [Chloroflexi bacterium]|nr:PD40 domain-containing protein [Chloroflexota bacterium]